LDWILLGMLDFLASIFCNDIAAEKIISLVVSIFKKCGFVTDNVRLCLILNHINKFVAG